MSAILPADEADTLASDDDLEAAIEIPSSGSSRLASLFGGAAAHVGGGDIGGGSLCYAAPKQTVPEKCTDATEKSGSRAGAASTKSGRSMFAVVVMGSCRQSADAAEVEIGTIGLAVLLTAIEEVTVLLYDANKRSLSKSNFTHDKSFGSSSTISIINDKQLVLTDDAKKEWKLTFNSAEIVVKLLCALSTLYNIPACGSFDIPPTNQPAGTSVVGNNDKVEFELHEFGVNDDATLAPSLEPSQVRVDMASGSADDPIPQDWKQRLLGLHSSATRVLAARRHSTVAGVLADVPVVLQAKVLRFKRQKLHVDNHLDEQGVSETTAKDHLDCQESMETMAPENDGDTGKKPLGSSVGLKERMAKIGRSVMIPSAEPESNCTVVRDQSEFVQPAQYQVESNFNVKDSGGCDENATDAGSANVQSAPTDTAVTHQSQIHHSLQIDLTPVISSIQSHFDSCLHETEKNLRAEISKVADAVSQLEIKLRDVALAIPVLETEMTSIGERLKLNAPTNSTAESDLRIQHAADKKARRVLTKVYREIETALSDSTAQLSGDDFKTLLKQKMQDSFDTESGEKAVLNT